VRSPVDARTGLLLVGSFGAAGLAVWTGSSSPYTVPLAVLAGLCASLLVALRVVRSLPARPAPTGVMANTTLLLGGAVGGKYERGELYDSVVRLAIEMRVRDAADVTDDEEERLAEVSDEEFRGWMETQLAELERAS
jgi:hypothetical protein